MTEKERSALVHKDMFDSVQAALDRANAKIAEQQEHLDAVLALVDKAHAEQKSEVKTFSLLTALFSYGPDKETTLCTCGHYRAEHRMYNFFYKKIDTSCLSSGMDLGGYRHTECGCEEFVEAES